MPGKGEVRVNAGDTLIFETPGGGGYGDPAQRDRSSVAQDIADGLVSNEAASKDYQQMEGQDDV